MIVQNETLRVPQRGTNYKPLRRIMEAYMKVLSWSGVLVLLMFISFIIGFAAHFVIHAVTRRPEPTWKPTIPKRG
jgi:hypothetical protein